MPLIKNLLRIRSLSWPVAVATLSLLYLWGVTIVHLSVPWSNNPQYSYGWAVPFLCVFLIGRKIFQTPDARRQTPADAAETSALRASIFWLLALLYLPTRLIQVANPDWRFVGWALAIETVGLTLYFLGLAVRGSRFTVQDFIFPIGFFLVAVPWPTVVESPLIQALTRFDVRATCELVGWLGIPAIPHGNVIQVATGYVGIDEACSGIRSFQATLMISLFVGEYYQMSVLRRLSLCFVGFSLAILLNLVRQTVLVWVAAREGVPAIARWHDPTGVIILLGCFLALWGLGVWLSRSPGTRRQTPDASSPAPLQAACLPPSAVRGSSSALRAPRSALPALALLVWLLLVEVGVNGWYAWREAQSFPNPAWQVIWPTNAPAYTTIPFPEATCNLLRFNAGVQAAWELEDGRRTEVFYLRWNPGRTAGYLAKLHTPQICLPSAGLELVAGPKHIILSAETFTLPFQSYVFAAQRRRVDVFYCRWPDRGAPGRSLVGQSAWADRFRNVLEGRGNSGQRVLEIVLWDYPDAAAAQTAVQQLLEKIIVPSQ